MLAGAKNLQPIDNPIATRLSPMSPVRSVTHVSVRSGELVGLEPCSITLCWLVRVRPAPPRSLALPAICLLLRPTNSETVGSRFLSLHYAVAHFGDYCGHAKQENAQPQDSVGQELELEACKRPWRSSNVP